MPIKGFSMSKQLKKFAFSTASRLKKIKQTYRLKVLSDKTFDDSCNFLAYKILDLVRSPQIVTTMAGKIMPQACVTISLLDKSLDAAGIIANPELSGKLSAAIAAFTKAIEQRKAISND